MIAWWWVPVLLFIGAMIGMMISAVISANGPDDHKRWWDE